jgi:predicted DNA-binding protein with PD1-like motif
MIYKRDASVLFIRLDNGEDFYGTLYAVLKENQVTSGVFLSGIGMLMDFEIGWFNLSTKMYEKESYTEAYELLGLCGNLSVKEGELFAHFHASLSGKDHRVVGGHLFSGTVCNTVECFFTPFEHQLKRLPGTVFSPLGF